MPLAIRAFDAGPLNAFVAVARFLQSRRNAGSYQSLASRSAFRITRTVWRSLARSWMEKRAR
eukprot:15141750-Alexandrium_andersonii.AAC.1